MNAEGYAGSLTYEEIQESKGLALGQIESTQIVKHSIEENRFQNLEIAFPSSYSNGQIN